MLRARRKTERALFPAVDADVDGVVASVTPALVSLEADGAIDGAIFGKMSGQIYWRIDWITGLQACPWHCFIWSKSIYAGIWMTGTWRHDQDVSAGPKIALKNSQCGQSGNQSGSLH